MDDGRTQPEPLQRVTHNCRCKRIRENVTFSLRHEFKTINALIFGARLAWSPSPFFKAPLLNNAAYLRWARLPQFQPADVLQESLRLSPKPVLLNPEINRNAGHEDNCAHGDKQRAPLHESEQSHTLI